jgi:hypothetical protein
VLRYIITLFQLRKLYLVDRDGKITANCGLYKTWKIAVVVSWEWRSKQEIQETTKLIRTVGIAAVFEPGFSRIRVWNIDAVQPC